MSKNEDIKDMNERQVFLVEDDDMHSLMIEYLLSNETTAQIKKFKSGEECIKNLSLKPDVVILDYGLPGISGIQTLMGIKRHTPDLPVIVVTGNQDKQIEEQFLTAGAYDFIQKSGNAFERVGKLTESIIGIMAEKESKKQYRKNIRLVLTFLGTTIILVAAYLLIKYFNT